jgi:hypothetical protein
VFLGIEGTRPRFNLPATYAAGDLRARGYHGIAYGVSSGWFPAIEDARDFSVDVATLRERISTIIAKGRWTLRPTHIWFQTGPTLFRVTQSIVPDTIRLLPRKRFWGIVYPASYVLAIAALWAGSGKWTTEGILIVAGISAAWWGMWGLLVWPALRAAAPGRRSQRRL